MKVAAWVVLTAVSIPLKAWSQQEDTDSSEVLQQVIIRAYENNHRLTEVPAAVSVITKAELNRFSNTSLVPAFNANPGVRMEERSPGSYRLNIRGSSLRSPFGVRNVKVYYNNIPYTDPGGNTFLNQIGFYNIGSVEIIKGPGSSLYGAGTGGVILLSSDDSSFIRGAAVNYVGGSFGMNSANVNVRGGNEDIHHSFNYQYQNSDGYREQTNMERKVISWDGVAKVGSKGMLRAHFLQGDLFYQTPGALTAAEFNANPKAARPRAGQTPGAVEAHAAINQKLYLAGLNYELAWSDHWRSTTSIYGAYSRLLNPTTRNYERRTEPHFGSRGVIQYTGNIDRSKISLLGGVELQQEFGASKVYTNIAGNPGSLLSDDEIMNKQYSLFTQGMLELPKGWSITAGVSLNILDVTLQRLSEPTSLHTKRYNNEFAPRLAVLKKVNPSLSVYGSVSKGFSPPTNEELLPSTGEISTGLEAENGIDMEAGLKGNLLGQKLYYDINAFYFRLVNTIVQRRDISGGDYFVNAGNTRQYGLETYVHYRLLDRSDIFFSHVKIWVSHTWHNFHYLNYQKVTEDTADYSGKRLPSIPPHYVAAGIDMISHTGLYANLSYYYSDPLPLNDANTDYASSYNLCDARIGFRKSLKKNMRLDIFCMADNLFNVRYSLGNDINAFGGRYYNAAPGINYAAGISLRYTW